MGLTSALNTALNGLTLNEVAIDVLGNNIANAGTNGFKSSKVLFTTQLTQTLSVGSRPEGDNGGTNPMQVGLGATTAAILKDFAQGGITSSSSPSDLAIEGDGFFIVEGSEGALYTRDGSFQLDSENKLSTNSGLRVQGFGVVDGTFNIDTDDQIDDLEIDFGLTVAKSTESVILAGSLSTGEDAEAATQGSLLSSVALHDGTTGPPTTIIADPSTVNLTDVEDATGNNLFAVNDLIRFQPQKGGQALQEATFTVEAGNTLDDLLTFFQDTLGIQSGGTIPAGPGISINGSGEIEIAGNLGENNDISLISTSLQISSDNGATFTELTSLGLSKSQSANGESTSTSFIVFDSLGDPVDMRVTAYLESRTGSTTTYRYLIESADDSDNSIAVANGTISLDGDGKVINNDNASANVTIHRANTAADTLNIEVDFTNLLGILSTSEGSKMSLFSQDGSAPGTLTTFNINEAGVINGVFDNGLIRPLGQIVLGRFRNPQGLLDAGTGTFREGVSSGQAELVTAGTGGAGTIRSGAIELSNTDIGRDLVDLIVTSTNYRGNARVISSVQELVDELLILGR